MRKLIACLIWTISFYVGHGQTYKDGLIEELNRAIDSADYYDEQKLRMINQIKQQESDIPFADQTGLFNLYLQLYDAYKIFNYDSAYSYCVKLRNIADQLQDSYLQDLSKMKLSFILLSSGMFKEAHDSLQEVRFTRFPDSLKAEYYALMARYCYDLADYGNDRYYTPGYNQKGNHYLDSALRLWNPSSFAYRYFSGLRNIRTGNRAAADVFFSDLMNDQGLSYHELALTASTLSDNYIEKDQTDTAIQLLIQAAIADIKTSTKETAAMFNLAALLFKRGDLVHSSAYIKKAIQDAFFYGARQRKIQVSAILPLIEGEKVSRIESEKKKLFTYAAGTTLLLMVLAALMVIIFRQLRKIKSAQQEITAAHIRQQEINQKLIEANKIKDEYIGYFFNGNSEFYAKMEKFKEKLEAKVRDRKLDEIKSLANTINIKKEREELLANFDRIFLKLFPHFIEEFNLLFLPEDQVVIKPPQLLNTDLRIYALIRIGIHDSEKIASILEYSVNTINTYKTKIKNKSTVPNEVFEQRIMMIKSI